MILITADHIMNTHWITRTSTTLLLAFAASITAHAQLPTMTQAPWIGLFAVHSDNRQTFSIDSSGDMMLLPEVSGKRISHQYGVKISPRILETTPTGKIISKKINLESLESPDNSTDKLAKTTYKGKTTGDASFEVTAEQERGVIFVTGRILDPGTLKNPLSFAISVKVPNLYPGELKSLEGLSEREKRREEKALADKLKGDRATFKWADGKSLRLATIEGADMKAEALSGPGIVSLELESTVFINRKLMINASPHTMMSAIKADDAPLIKGLDLRWLVDPTKDPDGKARLALQFR